MYDVSEKRYVLIYALILSVSHYFISKLNNLCGEIIDSIWPIDIIILIMTLLVLALFDRNQKIRIALGFIFKKQPFEKGSKWIKNEKRIIEADRDKLIK